MSSITIDPSEVEKFGKLAALWWDPSGPFRPLHELNPVRVGYCRDQICAHFGRNPTNKMPLSGLTLLDVGCGGGLVSEPMAELGASVTGFDASEKNVRIAALHAQAKGLNVTYTSDTMDRMHRQGKIFDVILALEVVEHVADVPEFMAELHHVLKPGGLLIFSTINRTFLSFFVAIIGAEYLMRVLPRGTHQWSKFLPPRQLSQALQVAGFRSLDPVGLTYHPFRRRWRLSQNLGVNYFLSATKPPQAT